MSLPYGFMSSPNGLIIVDPEKASIVRTIYHQYLSGISLGGIADFLFDHGIPSPKRKERWTQPVLSNLLSNQKYIGYIVSFDDFFLVQGKRVNAATSMKTPISGRPPGTTLRVY